MKYKKMIINFKGVSPCEIDLVDRPILDRWIEVHNKNKKNSDWWSRKSTLAHQMNSSLGGEFKRDDYVYEHSPKKINEVIDEIKKLTGVEWDIRAYSGMGFETCNKLHRYFTTSEEGHRTYKLSDKLKKELFEEKIRKYPFEWWYWGKFSLLLDNDYGLIKTFKDKHSKDNKKLSKYLHIINSEIHRYEDNCLDSKRSHYMYKNLGGEKLRRVLDIEWNTKGHHGEILQPIDWHRNFLQEEITAVLESLSVDSDEFNVFQVKKIKGKDYNLAYQQYDNPTEWDITRTFTLSGELTLDPFGMFNKFYNSNMFKEWLKRYKHPYNPKIFGLLPIGKIVSMESLKNVDNIDTPLHECKTPFHSETHKTPDEWSVIDTKFYK